MRKSPPHRNGSHLPILHILHNFEHGCIVQSPHHITIWEHSVQRFPSPTMWPHARSAFSRRIHLSGKGEVAKSIRLSPIPNRAQVRSKGIEKIRLPISWRGLSVQEEAIEYWKANIRGTKDTPSSVYIEQMKLPLVLEMDRELGRKTIFTPYGIRFGPKDPLGAKLLEVARPVSWSQSWSRSSRWIRWTVYYLLLLTSVFCFSREKVPIIGLWQFNCIQHWLSERIIQEDFNSRDEAIQMFQDALLPYDHPLVQRVRSILGRVVRASGLEHVDWDFQIITAPGECRLCRRCVRTIPCLRLYADHGKRL